MSEATGFCIACGATEDFVPWLRGRFASRSGTATWEYSLLRCTGCGMGRLAPLPSPEILNELYQDDYGTYQETAVDVAGRLPQRAKLAFAKVAGRALRAGVVGRFAGGLQTAGEIAAGLSVSLTSSLPLALAKDAPILDFGCGSGWWLLGLRHLGYENLWGFDVEHAGLDVLVAHKVSVVTNDVGKLPDNHFRCIRLHHVLEHMVDPLATLMLLRGKLQTGGSIVLEVPNFASASAQALGENWRGLKLPHHLSHFTVGALQALARRAGLQIERARFVPSFPLARPMLGKGVLQRQRHYLARRESSLADCVATELRAV